MSETKKYFDSVIAISDRIGDDISNYFYNRISSVFNSIRNDYLNNNKVNVELIKEYFNLLKYEYSESMELYNKCSNINGIIDEEFDKMLREVL